MVGGPFMYFIIFFACLKKHLKSIGHWGRASRLRLAPVILLAVSLSGCTSLSPSSLSIFSFGGAGGALSPDCAEIEQRMQSMHKKYARALRRERPAIYLTFTGNLSRSMTQNQLSGIYQMTDYHLDTVVDRTVNTCVMASLTNNVCQGANRLGRAYKPLVLVAREAHENYCGKRVIR